MFDRLLRTDPILAGTGLAMLAAMPPTLMALALDDRVFAGDPVWLKPLKFQAALALYLMTLAFFARWVPADVLQSRRYRIYAAVVSFCVMAEVVWIMSAAGLATASHFNRTDMVFVVLYPLMGLFAVILTSVSGAYGWLILRHPQAGLEPSLRRAIGLGLILTSVMTVIVAGFLSQLSGHFIGTPVAGVVVPFMGWSREVGDVRVAHFLATHAMHVLPLAGLVILLLPGAVLRNGAVALAAVGYVGLVAFTFVQALNGLPFLPMI